jgi:hypothetical protein
LMCACERRSLTMWICGEVIVYRRTLSAKAWIDGTRIERIGRRIDHDTCWSNVSMNSSISNSPIRWLEVKYNPTSTTERK